MSDCCLTPRVKCSAISREEVVFQWDDFYFVLEQHVYLDFYWSSSLKQQSGGRHVAPLVHIITLISS